VAGDRVKKENIQDQIMHKIKSYPAGKIFMYSDFLDLAETSTLRKAFKRLVDDKELTRVFNGMFAILEYSNILKKEVYPSIPKIAQAIATKFMWEIYPSGNTALNVVGLSTQVPNTYEYLSDGPYKEYEYLGKKIKFKKTSNKKLKIGSDKLVTLVIAIDYLGKDKIGVFEKNIIKNYAAKNLNKVELIKETRMLSEWIYILLKEIYEELENNIL
jgi:hypothetical protein